MYIFQSHSRGWSVTNRVLRVSFPHENSNKFERVWIVLAHGALSELSQLTRFYSTNLDEVPGRGIAHTVPQQSFSETRSDAL